MGGNSSEYPENERGRQSTGQLSFRLGRHELVVRYRYEILSITNDLMVGVWFAVGSVLFFSSATMDVGTWLFLIGSLQLFIRPVIRLTRNLHLQRISSSLSRVLTGTSHDF